MKNITIALLCFGICAATVGADPKAEAIMRKSIALQQTNDMSVTTYMVLREANGTQASRKLLMYTKKTANGTNSFIEFLSPADVKGTRFLIIGNDSGPDDQRLWLPELGRVRKIASNAKTGKFMGSDLTYYDMEERSFNESMYSMYGEGSVTATKDGVKKTMPCDIIKNVPKDPESPYSYILMWAGTEDGYVYKSEMYDKRGAKEKTVYVVEAGSFKDKIIPIKTLVVNANGHQTLLYMEDMKIDSGLDDSIFTVRNLER